MGLSGSVTEPLGSVVPPLPPPGDTLSHPLGWVSTSATTAWRLPEAIRLPGSQAQLICYIAADNEMEPQPCAQQHQGSRRTVVGDGVCLRSQPRDRGLVGIADRVDFYTAADIGFTLT